MATEVPRLPITLVVQRTERLTPHLVRVVVGGDSFGEFTANEFTDQYVKLVFPRVPPAPGEPIDWLTLRARPAAERPVLRTYTVRWHDPLARELAIDFVVHGDEGVAGPWAARAAPGDVLHLLGPGGAYAPRPDAPWHLLVGDDAALPAIAAALEAMPAGARAIAVLEVDGVEDELAFTTAADLDVTWLHRSVPGTPDLFDAVRARELPPGRGHGFVHGELSTIRRLRTHLLEERSFAPEDLSISGYWKRGLSEEGFQAEKQAGRG